jgi:hypothetical protein
MAMQAKIFLSASTVIYAELLPCYSVARSDLRQLLIRKSAVSLPFFVQ